MSLSTLGAELLQALLPFFWAGLTVACAILLRRMRQPSYLMLAALAASAGGGVLTAMSYVALAQAAVVTVAGYAAAVMIGIGLYLHWRRNPRGASARPAFLAHDMAKRANVFAALFENTREGFSYFDQDLNVIAYNRKFLELLDFPPEPFNLGDPFEKFIRYNAERGEYGPGDPDEQVRERVELARQFKAHSFERERPDGRVLLIQGDPVPGGGFVTTYMDITERKQAENALKERDQLYRSLLRNVPSIITMKNLDGRYVLANQGAGRFLRQDPNLVIGKRTEDIFDAPLAAFHKRWDAKIRATGEAETREFDQVALPDGHVHDIMMTKFPVVGRDGQQVGTGTISTNITALKNAERELERHRDHLADLVAERTAELQSTQESLVQAERLATMAQLTATVSHELRNPLGTIQSSFYIIRSILEREGVDVPKALARIDRNIDRCARIIDELLDYTRISGLNRVNVKFDAWCNTFAADLDIPDTVKLTVDCQPNLTASIDTVQTHHLLENLIQNAWQALADSNNAGRGGRIDLTVRQTDGRLVIRVADNGPGVDDGMKEKIFEPLTSTKVYGIGLGLPLVKRIVTLYGGSIRVEDNQPHGAVFVIELPVRTAEIAGLSETA